MCIRDRYLGDIYRFLGMESTGQFTIIMLLAIIAAFVLKNIFLYFQNVIQLRFVYTNQFATSRKMMINFMERPYEYYLNADTSVIQMCIRDSRCCDQRPQKEQEDSVPSMLAQQTGRCV